MPVVVRNAANTLVCCRTTMLSYMENEAEDSHGCATSLEHCAGWMVHESRGSRCEQTRMATNLSIFSSYPKRKGV